MRRTGILKLRGLPFCSNDKDIQQFFEGACETRNACVLCGGGPVADTTKNNQTDRLIHHLVPYFFSFEDQEDKGDHRQNVHLLWL